MPAAVAQTARIGNGGSRMRVLVVGASGRLGGAVARRLLAEPGVEVVVGSRRPDELGELAASGAKAVELDLRRPETLVRSLAGIEAVLQAAHALTPVRGNPSEEVDRDGVAALVDEAVVAGVRRMVLASVVHAAPGHPVDFWRFKHAAEERLASSGLEHRSLRFAAFVETHALELLGEPMRVGKAVPVAGSGEVERSWIAVDDAADVAVDALLDRGAVAGRPRVLDVAGPRNATTNEVLAWLASGLGTEPRVRRLPVAVPAIAGRLLAPFAPAPARLARTIAWVGAQGDAVSLDPRPDLVVAPTPVDRVIADWAASPEG